MTTTPTLDRLYADMQHSIIPVQKRAAYQLVVLLDGFFEAQRRVESYAKTLADAVGEATDRVFTFSPYAASSIDQHTSVLTAAITTRTAMLSDIERMCDVLDIEWAAVMNEYRAALKALDTRA